jgi:hypothetical protein
MEEHGESTGRELAVLVPQEVREVNFYGDVLLVALVNGIPYVALRPIVDFLSIDWAPQYQRLQRDDILDEERRLVVMAGADGRQREMVSLPLEFLPGWLFGIVGSRFKDREKAAKLKRYRRECFRALWREFGQPLTSSVSPGTSTLVQVRDLGLAVAQLAEEQIELQGQVETINVDVGRAHSRLDRAAEVVGSFQRRLTTVERRVLPAECISDEQAAEIALSVKALAELLTGQTAQRSGGGKIPNYYQGVFTELYRRFGVTKYTLVRQVDYQAVLTFLDDWRKAAQKG